jgi:hypothetical protein
MAQLLLIHSQLNLFHSLPSISLRLILINPSIHNYVFQIIFFFSLGVFLTGLCTCCSLLACVLHVPHILQYLIWLFWGTHRFVLEFRIILIKMTNYDSTECWGISSSVVHCRSLLTAIIVFVASGMPGAIGCYAPTTNLDAPTRNMQNMKHKHVGQPANNVRRPTASTCYLCFTSVVGGNSVLRMCVYARCFVQCYRAYCVISVGLFVCLFCAVI